MYAVVGVRIARLESENRSVWRRVQLHHGLHRKGPIDEVRRLVVDVFHVYYHSLIVGI